MITSNPSNFFKMLRFAAIRYCFIQYFISRFDLAMFHVFMVEPVSSGVLVVLIKRRVSHNV